MRPQPGGFNVWPSGSRGSAPVMLVFTTASFSLSPCSPKLLYFHWMLPNPTSQHNKDGCGSSASGRFACVVEVANKVIKEDVDEDVKEEVHKDVNEGKC